MVFYQCLPIYICKEGVLLQLLNTSSCSKSVLRISDEKLFEEIKSYSIDLELFLTFIRPINLFLENVLENFFGRLIIEWQISSEELVTNDSK